VPVICMDVEGGSYWHAWLEFLRGELVEGGRINPEDLDLFKITSSPQEACDEIVHFYRNYHSMRFVGDQLVIRVHRFPSKELMDELIGDYTDILHDGSFEVTKALPEESRNEPELNDLPRIMCKFNRYSHGRLRSLINRLNADG